MWRSKIDFSTMVSAGQSMSHKCAFRAMQDDEPVVLGDSVSGVEGEVNVPSLDNFVMGVMPNDVHVEVRHEGSNMLAGSDVTKVTAGKIMVTEEGYFSTKVTVTVMHNPIVMVTHDHVTHATCISGSNNVPTEPTCIYLILNLGDSMTVADTYVVNGLLNNQDVSNSITGPFGLFGSLFGSDSTKCTAKGSKSTFHINEVTPSSSLLNGASLVGSGSHNVTNTGSKDNDSALNMDTSNINAHKDLLEQISVSFYDGLITGLNPVDLNSSLETIKSLL
nr:hypothetical protein [Tanacetum cinerariifolium]